jgi:hypothetical protein
MSRVDYRMLWPVSVIRLPLPSSVIWPVTQLQE